MFKRLILNLKLPVLMFVFMLVWVHLMEAVYPLIARQPVPQLTQQQIEDAHRRAYGKELYLKAAYASYEKIKVAD